MNQIKKGDLVATTVTENSVTLWIQSPTGDSSDCHLFTMPTHTHKQAVDIANKWNQMFDIDVFHLDYV
jgi:hypothetical protein